MTNNNKGIKEKFQLWMSDRWWGFLVLSYGLLYATIIYKTMTDFLTDNGLTYDQLPESKYNRYFWHMYTAIFLWGSLINGMYRKNSRSVFIPAVLLMMMWSSLPQLWVFQLGYAGMIVFLYGQKRREKSTDSMKSAVIDVSHDEKKEE